METDGDLGWGTRWERKMLRGRNGEMWNRGDCSRLDPSASDFPSEIETFQELAPIFKDRADFIELTSSSGLRRG